MTLKDMMEYYPQKYVCVHNTKIDAFNIIIEADILCIYDTLKIAVENKNMIKNYMKHYSDFDIIYCDYADYITTRKNSAHIADDYFVSPQDEWPALFTPAQLEAFEGCIMTTQCEIDSLLKNLANLTIL